MGAPECVISQAKDCIAPPGYRRYRPEATLPYRLAAEHCAGFRGLRAAEGRSLQRHAIAKSPDFSLHAGIGAKALQRNKIERLARYVSRPPVATERLSLMRGGNVRYALKTPYRDGTTPVIFEPEDFIARLAALVPKPRAHLTRYHAVFAAPSPDRARIVPGTHGVAATEPGEAVATGRQGAKSWAQRLKRLFAIDMPQGTLS